MSYVERYCAFVDVLAFRSLINRLRSEPEKYRFLVDLLQTIHSPKPGSGSLPYLGSDFKAQSISDAVAVSAAPNTQGLRHIVDSLIRLSIDLLKAGYFVRGGLVRGRLYHDDKMVFGEALVQAYQLENEVAKYPRIIVSSALAKEIRDSDRGSFAPSVRQASDGPHYLHALRYLETIARHGPHDMEDHLADLKLILAAVQERFDEAADSPHNFEKVQWFARYWNEICSGMTPVGLKYIEGVGLQAPKPLFAKLSD